MCAERLEQKAGKLIKQYKMIENHDNILVAFSGGSDSSALLFFLLKYCGRERIYAAHMNHMIRGQDAYGDEEFAVQACKKYGVKIFAERRDVPEIARKSKKTMEEAARDARYDFLSRIAKELGENTKIATAHTASDNTETVIFNMARGCGINGLRGIIPVNANIIRPLLSCDKDDILQYCGENNLSYVEDKTNREDYYTRNFIRHNVVSKLKEKFAKIDENIFKMTDIMRGNADFIDLCAENILKENYRVNDGIDISCLISQHKALRYAVILKIYENIALKKLEHRHVLYIDEIICKGVNTDIDLPGHVKARVLYNKFNIFTKIKNKSKIYTDFEKNISHGVNIIYDTDDIETIEIIFSRESDEYIKSVNNNKCGKINLQSLENIYNLFNYAVIDFDKIKGRIFARNRKSGDEYVFFGQTKSVQKNYINYKVPADIRNRLPVFYDGDGIFWACGLPAADRVKVSDDTKNAVSIRVNKL